MTERQKPDLTELSEAVIRGTEKTAEQSLYNTLRTEHPDRLKCLETVLDAWIRRCGRFLTLDRVDKVIAFGFAANRALRRIGFNEAKITEEQLEAYLLGHFAAMARLASTADHLRPAEKVRNQIERGRYWLPVLNALWDGPKSWNEVHKWLKDDHNLRLEKKRSDCKDLEINDGSLHKPFRQMKKAGLIRQSYPRAPWELTVFGRLVVRAYAEDEEIQPYSFPELETENNITEEKNPITEHAASYFEPFFQENPNVGLSAQFMEGKAGVLTLSDFQSEALDELAELPMKPFLCRDKNTGQLGVVLLEKTLRKYHSLSNSLKSRNQLRAWYTLSEKESEKK